jgi:hypothetical protein
MRPVCVCALSPVNLTLMVFSTSWVSSVGGLWRAFFAVGRGDFCWCLGLLLKGGLGLVGLLLRDF